MTEVKPEDGGPISEPNVNDVLSGRGGRINSHAGNIQFRELVNRHKHTYLSKQTKKLDKVKIANEIVQTIRRMNPPGRFLKEDKKGNWLEIGDEKAKKKAGQAMREKADETRKELGGHGSGNEIGQQSSNQMNMNMGGNQQQFMNSNVAQLHPSIQQQYFMQQQQHATQFSNPNYAMNMGYSPSASPNPQQLASMSPSFQNPPSPGAGAGAGGFANMSPLQIEQYSQEQRMMHAAILKGNAVAFDREFHRLRSDESGVSRINSLSGGSSNSNRNSSSSSMMSALSSGVLNQNELLQLALQQQQITNNQQQHQQQQMASNQMAVLDEQNEWNDKWDRDDATSGVDTGTIPSAGIGIGAGAGGGIGMGISMGNARGTGTVSSGSVISGSSGGSGGTLPSAQSNRRRMFAQSRGQSYLPSDLKAAEAGTQQPVHASQLLRASLGTVGSMNMESMNMSSVGFGSTNMMSSINLGASTNSMAAAMSQARTANMQQRMSAMGLDTMTASDNSLMNLLADAAANSVSLGSTSSFSFMSATPGTFEKPNESNGSMLSEGSGMGLGLASGGGMNNMLPPRHGNVTQHEPSPVTSGDISSGISQGDTAIGANANNIRRTDTNNIDPIPLNTNFPTETRMGLNSMKPPERGIARGISTKSDISMDSGSGGSGSWYGNEVKNLASLRNLANADMGDSRLRLFSENSAR